MAHGDSAKARETRGLDPSIHTVTLGVHRLEGEALGRTAVAAIRAALAPEALSLSSTARAATSGQEPAMVGVSTGNGGE